ncbi:ExbD/TolR family protein [Fimbriiglobus ruber]|uniref:Biopolymer transport protein ExbD/TolR n=1 Tax=Fimbriiglobus ruber TaxID=1908690 RepID=A0A225DZH8_9BACT|nr:biopolymer transporter ExbD [Fimbriiglobus ruber]OWK43156.1 hypothetical protein FRUB_02755 [Fimbriiglobus ruber]
MSASSSHEKCEPNLTPLLDMVLQLIMFFMLCANFVNEQVVKTIELPNALATKPVEKTTQDYLILNVNKQGTTLVANEALDGPAKVQRYMQNQFEIDKAKAAQRGKAKEWEAGKGRSLIILRADKECHFKQVNDVMAACRRAGYTDIQLRAIQASALGGQN